MELNIDVGQVRAFLDGAEKIMENMSSAQFRGKALKSLSQKSRDDFYQYTDMQASQDSTLGHVYEWGMRGNPAGRLFFMEFAKSNQYVAHGYYEFFESDVPVPVGDANAKDTRWRQHIFYAKAWVFEEGGTAIVSPVDSEWLAWPSGDDMRFSNRSVRITYSTQFVNRFSAHWYQYWNSNRAQASAQSVAAPLERDLRNASDAYLIKETRKGSSKGRTRMGSALSAAGGVRVRILDRGKPLGAISSRASDPHLERLIDDAEL